MIFTGRTAASLGVRLAMLLKNGPHSLLKYIRKPLLSQGRALQILVRLNLLGELFALRAVNTTAATNVSARKKKKNLFS